ncbi:MAG TPA: DegT/DnrJ/EryC1/StrS family aminotransferase [Firmicutes bacterium]|nr:DegT/DnrJ/EryC1/StrS family aminotransferase [Bacillota bacterium]
MSGLALTGGDPVRKKAYPKWPVWGAEERNNLLEVLESGRWGSLNGHFAKDFAVRFAQAQDARFGVGVTNGTIALQVAVEAVGVKPGDEVIVPPYTFIATASAVLSAGGVPVFADITPDTFCLDPEAVKQAITPRTKAVIPVHLGGHPADMDAFREIGRQYGLRVIEDAAHAHGSEWRGKKVGALGDMGCFSFQWSKNMTGGEGGAVLTNNEELYARAWSIMNVGRRPEGEWYEHVILGGNHRMNEFAAAVLCAQLGRLEAQTEHRARMAAYLDKQLSAIEGIEPQARDSRVTRQGFHLYVFRYKPEAFGGVPRNLFIKAMLAEGIPVTPGYSLLNKQEVFSVVQRERTYGFAAYPGTIDYMGSHLPVAQKLADEEGCWMPQNVLLGNEEDMEDIVRAVRKIKEHLSELKALAS